MKSHLSLVYCNTESRLNWEMISKWYRRRLDSSSCYALEALDSRCLKLKMLFVGYTDGYDDCAILSI